MRQLKKSFVVTALLVSLAVPAAYARPNQDDGGAVSGIGTRIVQLIKHLVRVVHDDPSYPKP